MRLTAICEALSKPLAEKVYKQFADLSRASDQDPMPFGDFMTYVRDADISSNMPHGNYILKIYAFLIANMFQKAQLSAQEERDNDILPIDLDLEEIIGRISENAKFYIGKFVAHKPRLAAAGQNTDINSYIPTQADGSEAFAPIERALKQLGELSEMDVKTRGLTGVKLLKTVPDPENESIIYRVYHVTNPQSLSDIAMGFAGGDEVGWCTKSNQMAQQYTNTSDNYVIFRNNQPSSQFSICKTGPTHSNPFATIGKIAEHKDSQNQDERRRIMQEIAKDVESLRADQLRTQFEQSNVDYDAFQKMLAATQYYINLQGQAADELVKKRFEEYYKAIESTDAPLLKNQFKNAGLDMAKALSSIAGTNELGLPTSQSDLGQNKELYKRTMGEVLKRISENEEILKRIQNPEAMSEQIKEIIVQALAKAKKANIEMIRLILALVDIGMGLQKLQ